MEYIVIVIAVWVIFCFLVASMAKKRGRDQADYVFLAILLSPLIAMIVLLIQGESDAKRLEKIKEEEEVRISVKSPNTISAPVTAISSLAKYESLEKLGNLLEKGIITKEEFDIEKKNILSENTGSIKQENKVPDKAEEIYQDKTVDPVSTSICEKIQVEIKKAKAPFSLGLNDKLVELLRDICVNETNTINLLDNYQKLYGNDLITTISGLSSSYDGIKYYLGPIIDKGVIDSKYPHDRIK
ncbi:MAG: SHOCT domain-containing protein [Bacteroidia bacterium]